MADDIVTRLREGFVTHSQAADEIERLRKQRDQLVEASPCVCMLAGDENCTRCKIKKEPF